MDDGIVHRTLVQPHGYDGHGLEEDFLDGGRHELAQHHVVHDLDAAGGGTGAGPDETDRVQKHLGGLGPLFVVGRGKSRGGQQAGHLKGAVADGVQQAVGVLPPENPGNHAAEKQHEADVPAEFRVDPQGPPVPFDHLVEQHEGHAPQKHEQDDDPVEIGAVVVPDAGIPWGITGGGNRAEGVAHGIEQGHAAETQEDDLRNVQHHVDDPQADHGIAVAGMEFLLGDDLAR